MSVHCVTIPQCVNYINIETSVSNVCVSFSKGIVFNSAKETCNLDKQCPQATFLKRSLKSDVALELYLWVFMCQSFAVFPFGTVLFVRLNKLKCSVSR